MTDLADFLLARIAEDEALARARVHAPEWHGIDAWGEETTDYVFAHNGPCDPARVLAECDAKRLMITEVSDHIHGVIDDDSWDDIGECPCYHMQKLLALPYADHPDYRAEWKP